ncbi:MAG: hypothetical protein K8S23_16275 [Candidatus Cloacimonetes bacterium]|nr:hypothetical protein [Candidatus Cloacimonadota bacterium]
MEQNLIFIAEDTGKEVWKYDFNSELVITVNNAGSVLYEPNPTGFYGSLIALIAVPDEGNYFHEWSDDLIGSTNPETLLMDYDRTVTATFTFLNSPENIIININSDSAFIQWDAVPEVSSYNVYSSENPNTDYSSWFLEHNTCGTSWHEELSSNKKFYLVKSVKQ